MKYWFFCIVFYLLEINSKYTEITWTMAWVLAHLTSSTQKQGEEPCLPTR